MRFVAQQRRGLDLIQALDPLAVGNPLAFADNDAGAEAIVVVVTNRRSGLILREFASSHAHARRRHDLQGKSFRVARPQLSHAFCGRHINTLDRDEGLLSAATVRYRLGHSDQRFGKPFTHGCIATMHVWSESAVAKPGINEVALEVRGVPLKYRALTLKARAVDSWYSSMTRDHSWRSQCRKSQPAEAPAVVVRRPSQPAGWEWRVGTAIGLWPRDEAA